MLSRFFPNVYEGWIVVGASGLVTLLVAASFFYGFGTIFNEVIDEFGWSVGATSLAFSLRSAQGGIASPLIGMVLDRVGPRRVMLLGLFVSAAGVVMMSFMQNLWQFYACMLITAIGTSASGGQVGQAAIATWFEQRRGRAMALMTLGGAAGGVLVVGVAFLVEAYGWRWALRVLALLMLTVGVVAGIQVRNRPRYHGQPMDGIRRPDWDGDEDDHAYNWGIPIRHAVRSRAFLLISLGIIASQFGSVAFVIHQIPYLERSLDVSKAAAGGTVALFTVTSIAGRLGFGYLADIYPKRVILVIAMGCMAVGLPMLAVTTEFWQAIIAILLIAQGFGGTIPVRPAMLADYFGTRNFATINGLTRLSTTGGGAVGAWAVGYMVDVTGSYDAGWVIAGLAVLIGMPAMAFARPPDELIAAHRTAPGRDRASEAAS